MLEAFRMLRFFLKAAPVAFLCLLPLVAAYDWISPAPLSDAALSSYGTQFRICVGYSYQSIRDDTGRIRNRHGRSYVLIPRVFESPALVSVHWTGDLSRRETTESRTGFLVFVVANILFVYLAWRWWVKPYRDHGREGLRRAV